MSVNRPCVYWRCPHSGRWTWKSEWRRNLFNGFWKWWKTDVENLATFCEDQAASADWLEMMKAPQHQRDLKRANTGRVNWHHMRRLARRKEYVGCTNLPPANGDNHSTAIYSATNHCRATRTTSSERIAAGVLFTSAWNRNILNFHQPADLVYKWHTVGL